MHTWGWGIKHRTRKLVAFLALITFLVGFVGVVNPEAAVAKTEESEPATEFTVLLNDNGEITHLATYTMEELEQMPQVERAYSSVDSLPAPVFTAARGLDLIDFLEWHNIDPDTIERFKFYATDLPPNYGKSYKKDTLLSPERYYFPQIAEYWDEYWDGDERRFTDEDKVGEGGTPIRPMLAIKSYQARAITSDPGKPVETGPRFDLMDGSTALRLCLGQDTPSECSTMNFLKWTYKMEVFGKLQEGSASVRLHTPQEGKTYFPRDTLEITGRVHNVTDAHLVISAPDNTTIFIEELSTDSGEFTTQFTLPDTAAFGEYRINISAEGPTGQVGEEKTFRVIDPGLEVRLTTPQEGQNFSPGDTVTISGTVYNVETAGTVILDIISPNGNNLYNHRIEETDFTMEFELPKDAVSGAYAIEVSGKYMDDYTRIFQVVATGTPTDPGEVEDGDEVLTITGDGISSPVEITRSQLEEMPQVEYYYSTVNRVPLPKLVWAKGVPLTSVLNKAGVNLSSIRKITLKAADGYEIEFTKKELLDTTRYRFPEVMSGSKDDAEPVPTIIALDNEETGRDFRLVLGQRVPTEQNNYNWVKYLETIEVSRQDPGKWEKVTSDPPGGSTVNENTDIKLKHPGVPWRVKIYYTTDGNDPTLDSEIYNYYFAEEENDPIRLTGDTTIKAMAVGAGKEHSDVASFEFKFDSTPQSQSETLKPDEGGTVSYLDQVVIEISPGALTGTEEQGVKIERVQAEAVPDVSEGTRLASDVYEITVGEESTYEFAEKVTVKLKFNVSDLKPGETAAVHYYDQKARKWVNIGGTVSDDFITVEVDHFTLFAVMFVVGEEVKLEEEPEEKPTIVFQDIINHWAREHINRLVTLGAISGYPDGTFQPNRTITRAEFTVVLVKAFQLAPQKGKIFADTAEHWAKEYIATATAHGIVGGYNDRLFGPNDPITREQMAAMIVKAARLTPTAGSLYFTDHGDISAWAINSIGTAVEHGIIKGYPDNTFKPRGHATRAEAVTVVVKALPEPEPSPAADADQS